MMSLPKWGIGAALLSAVALVGCEGGVNEVQDEQEDVIEAEQELSEEQAELNQAEEKAAIENVENGEALELNDPTVTPPLPGDEEEMAAPGENPFATPPEPAAPDPTIPSTDPEPASEAADNAATTNGDDSADGAAETPAPAPAPEE